MFRRLTTLSEWGGRGGFILALGAEGGERVPLGPGVEGPRHEVGQAGLLARIVAVRLGDRLGVPAPMVFAVYAALKPHADGGLPR